MTLKPYRGHLQSCALLVDEESKKRLRSLFLRAGLTRLGGAHLSLTWPLEAHDGVYALRCYSRLVDIED
ncbi:MAG: acyl-CoA reductase [Bacilli bacterium]